MASFPLLSPKNKIPMNKFPWIPSQKAAIPNQGKCPSILRTRSPNAWCPFDVPLKPSPRSSHVPFWETPRAGGGGAAVGAAQRAPLRPAPHQAAAGLRGPSASGSDRRLGSHLSQKSVAVVVKTVLGSHFGVGEFTTHFRTYFCGEWDGLTGGTIWI